MTTRAARRPRLLTAPAAGRHLASAGWCLAGALILTVLPLDGPAAGPSLWIRGVLAVAAVAALVDARREGRSTGPTAAPRRRDFRAGRGSRGGRP